MKDYFRYSLLILYVQQYSLRAYSPEVIVVDPEAHSKPSIFKNEEPLSLFFLYSCGPHRETQLRFLAELFRSVIDRPGTTSPKILVTGDIGTGKTVLTQRFGTDITRTAKTLKLNLQYIHINCREFRGSLFMILKRVLQNFTP